MTVLYHEAYYFIESVVTEIARRPIIPALFDLGASNFGWTHSGVCEIAE